MGENQKRAFETDVDAALKHASDTLMAEMEELIQRAKILQVEHSAIVEQRRKFRLEKYEVRFGWGAEIEP